MLESAECANQQWAEYFDTMQYASFYQLWNTNSCGSKFEEEEAKKTEELRRAIAEATAEEKRLRQHIDRYKEHIARFMASFSSKVLKDE